MSGTRYYRPIRRVTDNWLPVCGRGSLVQPETAASLTSKRDDDKSAGSTSGIWTNFPLCSFPPSLSLILYVVFVPTSLPSSVFPFPVFPFFFTSFGASICYYGILFSIHLFSIYCFHAPVQSALLLSSLLHFYLPAFLCSFHGFIFLPSNHSFLSHPTFYGSLL